MSDPLTVTVDKDIADLAQDFLRNRREQAARAGAAVRAGDLDSLRRIGHELKGTAGSYGFHALSAIGANLESAAEDGDLPVCGDAVGLMVEFLDRVVIEPA